MSLNKKLSVVAIGSMLAISLVGCKNNSNDSNNSNTNQSYTPGGIEDKIENGALLGQEDIQDGIEKGLIQLD